MTPRTECDVAAVIVDFDCAQSTQAAIDSIVAGSVHPRLIVVVDNHGSLAVDAFASGPIRLELISPGANRGFAGGCNLGAAHAAANGFETILFANPDIHVSTDGILNILETLDGTGADAAAGLIEHGGFHGESFVGGRTVFSHRTGRIGQNHGHLREARLEVPYLHGALFAVRTSAFERVGGMDDRFFLYREEVDFFLRLNASGGTAVLSNVVVATHVGGVATGSVASPLRIGFMSRNYLLLAKVHGGWWTPLWLLRWGLVETAMILVRKGRRAALHHLSSGTTIRADGHTLATRWAAQLR